MRKIPFYPILLAMFSVMSLLANNIHEVNPSVSIRSFIIIGILSIVIMLFMKVLFKDWHKAAIASSLIIFMLMSYGHIYDALRSIPQVGLEISPHRFLLPVYIVIMITGFWWIRKKVEDASRFTYGLNIASVVLIIIPSFQIGQYILGTDQSADVSAVLTLESQVLSMDEDEIPPDIYYIILDTYTRGDALQRELQFDNSYFLDELRRRGFYVAECSRSNYGGTFGSLTSALNMNYISAIKQQLREHDEDAENYRLLLKHNLVRHLLEETGYTVVAFDTHYDWSRFSDADIYLSRETDSINLQIIEPFEAMLIKNTMGLLLTDLDYKTRPRILENVIEGVNFPYRGFAENQLFILDQLPRLSSLTGPKFVFVHILVPHVPRVFTAEGEIEKDTGYYGGRLSGAINDEYDRKGYTHEIEFINSELLGIVDELIRGSESDPIIILQGDTGKSGENTYQILNAYYLTDIDQSKLYPTISPVNSFRLIFNEYFGSDYELLSDRSYQDDTDLVELPETSDFCTDLP